MVICLAAIFLLYSVLPLRIWGMGFILWTDSYQRIGKDSFHSCYRQSWIWQRCIKIPQSSYCRYHFCLCCRFDQKRLLQNPPLSLIHASRLTCRWQAHRPKCMFFNYCSIKPGMYIFSSWPSEQIDMDIGLWLQAAAYCWCFSPDTPPACQILAQRNKASPPLKCLVAIIESIFSCISTTHVLLTMSD